MKGINRTLLAAAVMAVCALPAGAEPGQASVETHGVYVDAGAHGGGVLKVTGPNNFQYEQKVGAGQSAFLDLNVLKGLGVEDGGYSYELVVSPAMSESQKAMLADLRELGDTAQIEDMRKEGLMPAPMAPMSGFFTIDQGQIADPNQVEVIAPRNDLKGTTVGTKDQQILDDLIVDGSACIGQDCVNGESFGFDTIRIKENNLRIKAQDTSSSASFPSRDWQLTFNESSNGGANKFSIDDIDGARTPFTIEAGAPSHSLYVDDGGRIGVGTSTPVVEVHVVNGDSPTVRLEQDGSSGFTPQTWDMAGNETNWFVRDATNGSTLPLRIRPSAPSNSIYVDTDGDVGLGTTSPDAQTHTIGDVLIDNVDGGAPADTASLIVRNNGTTGRDMILLENGGPSRLALRNTAAANGGEWRFNHADDGLRIANSVSLPTATQFRIADNGDLHVDGSVFSGGGTCGGGCDFVFDSEYQMPTIEEHAAAMWENGYLPNVGQTIENQPINLSDKTGRMLNELETAHIYIEQLHNRIAVLEKAILEDKE